MPLPAMMNAPEQMLQGPGLSAGATAGNQPGNQTVNVKDQVRGAIQALAQWQKSTSDQLSAVAQQFPTVAEDLQRLQQTTKQGTDQIVKKLVQTVQQQEPDAPTVLR